MSDKSPGPVFMIGCVRSGTTLLRDLMRHHPAISCPEETQYYRWGDPFGTTAYLNQVGKHELMKKHRQMDGLVEDEFQKLLANAKSRRELHVGHMRAFLAARGAQPGARWFDKSPQNVYGLPLLLHDFPQARFVHIIRNPLNVVTSLLTGRVIAAPSVVAAANYWNEAVSIVNVCKPLMTDSLHEIRYEELVEQPKQMLRNLCIFMRLNPDKLNADAIKTHKERNLYQQSLKARDLECIRTICGTWATRYGYDLDAALAEMRKAEAANDVSIPAPTHAVPKAAETVPNINGEVDGKSTAQPTKPAEQALIDRRQASEEDRTQGADHAVSN